MENGRIIFIFEHNPFQKQFKEGWESLGRKKERERKRKREKERKREREKERWLPLRLFEE